MTTSSAKNVFLGLSAVLAVAVLATVAEAAGDAPSLPNVLVIVSDDQGWMDIGYHGSDVMTPHLDELARTGAELNRYYVYTTCSPTRVGLLTGRNPSRYGVLGPIGGRSTLSIPKETVMLGDALQKAGYFTAISGKWHLGLRPEVGPLQFGFQSTYGYLHGQIDQYTHIYKNGDRTWHRQDKLIEEKGHATDLITAEAVRVVENSRDRSFFLYVTYSVPHYPVQEPDEWLAKYDGRILNPDRKVFAASLTHMDAGIGQIVDALERTGQRENTLLIYTSDNGGQRSWDAPESQYEGRFEPNEVLGNNRPLRGWKGDLYEGGIRVPGLVNWTGHVKRQLVDDVLTVLDWYPTICAAAGVEAKAEWKLEGKNVLPLLQGNGESPTEERVLYWKTSRTSALRKGDWKLVEHRSGDDARYELFQLVDDPYEHNDLSTAKPEKLEELRALLREQAELDG